MSMADDGDITSHNTMRMIEMGHPELFEMLKNVNNGM
jgi:hypothetical protein